MPALSLDATRQAGQAALNEALCVDAYMWIQGILNLPAAPSKSHSVITQHFLNEIETGVQLHKLLAKLENRDSPAVSYHQNAQPASFQARDNVASFLEYCIKHYDLPRSDVFESDDLVARKSPKAVALTIIQLSRAAHAKHAIAPTSSVQLEQEIHQQKQEDREDSVTQEDEVHHELQAAEESKEASEQVTTQTTKSDEPTFHETTALDHAIAQFLTSHSMKIRVVKVNIHNKKKKRNADRKAEYLIGSSKERVHVRMLHGLLVALQGSQWVSFDAYCESMAH